MSDAPALYLKINPAKPRVPKPSQSNMSFQSKDLVLCKKKGLEDWPASICDPDKEHLSSEVFRAKPRTGSPRLLNFLAEDRARAFSWAQERDLVLLDERMCRRWLRRNTMRQTERMIAAWQEALDIICARPDWPGISANTAAEEYAALSTSEKEQQDAAYTMSDQDSESELPKPTRTSLRVTLISRKPPKPILRSATRPKIEDPSSAHRSKRFQPTYDYHDNSEDETTLHPQLILKQVDTPAPIPSTSAQTLDIPAEVQQPKETRPNARKRQKLRLAVARPIHARTPSEPSAEPVAPTSSPAIELPAMEADPKPARKSNGHFARKAKVVSGTSGFRRRAAEVAELKLEEDEEEEASRFSVDIPAELASFKRQRPPASTSSVASTAASTATLSPALSSPMFNPRYTGSPNVETSVRSLLNTYSPSLGDRTHAILAEAGLVTTEDVRMFASQTMWRKFIEKTLKGKVSPAVEFLLIECLEQFFAQELD